MKRFLTPIFFLIFLSTGLYGAGLVPLKIHGKQIYAQIADTDSRRERGLMYRKYLPPNQGMLFVFPREQLLYFWMKNTLIPLDIAFIDSRGIIITIKTMRPLDTKIVASGKPARFALEVNAGFFAKNRLRAGESVSGIPKGSAPVRSKPNPHG